MNDIERLRERIAKSARNASFHLEAPNPPRPTAAWWLEIETGEYEVVVEWKPGRGFGISSPEGFGEGADEVYADVTVAARRVLELLKTREKTKAPEELALTKLRESRQISQEALAKALHIRQASVSKMERRPDMRVSTLEKAVAAMGGELEVRARFPGQDRRYLSVLNIAGASGDEGRGSIAATA